MLVGWLFDIAIIETLTNKSLKQNEITKLISDRSNLIQIWLDAESQSGYQVDKFLEDLKSRV